MTGFDGNMLDREQLRFAVVLNGGVSLAVWMGGAVHELDRLTHRVGDVYPVMLDWAMSDARVDVISGTSAGGINGAALALRQINQAPDAPDLGLLRDVWLESGSLQNLLRQPFQGSPLSLLKGDEFFLPELQRALQRLASPYVSAPLEGAPIDLTITTTLLRGVPGVVVDSAGQHVVQTRHDGLLRFRRDPTHPNAVDDFANDVVAVEENGVIDALALAARTTASYPVAFEPSYLWTGDNEARGNTRRINVDHYLSGAWDESQDGTRRARFAVDGGLLANTPMRPAMQAVDAMPAEGLVRRLLLLVHPHAPPVSADLHDHAAEPPSLVETGASLLKALTSEGSRNFVDLVVEHNRVAGGRRDIRADIVRRAAEGDDDDGDVGGDVGGDDDGDVGGDDDGDDTPAGRLYAQALCVYDLYRRQRLRRASRDLAEIWLSEATPSKASGDRAKETLSSVMPQILGVLEDSSDSMLVPPGRGGLPLAEDLGFQGAIDVADAAVDYLRRAMWEFASHPPLAGQVADARREVSRARNEILRAWRDFLSDVAHQAKRARSASERPSRDGLIDWVSAALAAAGDRKAGALVLRQQSLIAGAVSQVGPSPTWNYQDTALEAFGAVLFNGEGVATEEAVLKQLSAVQVITYVVSCENTTGNALPLGLVQLTYQVRHPFATQFASGEDKVAGDMMARFSGFLKRSWRMNDWTWGRLDAARVLSEAVLDHQRVRRYLEHRRKLDGDDAIPLMVQELLCMALRPSEYRAVQEAKKTGEPDAVIPDLPTLTEIEADRQRLGLPEASVLIGELESVLGGGPDAREPLAWVPEVFAVALALEVASAELPALPRAVQYDIDSGADRRSRGAVYVAGASDLFKAANDREDPARGWVGLEHFAAAGLGRESLVSEAGSDQMVQTAVTAAATGVTVLDGERSGLKALKPLTRTLRGAALLPYWIVRGLTGGNPLARSLAQLSLAVGGALVVLGLLGSAPAWVTAAGAALLLVALAYGALRSGTILHGVVLLIPALIALALILPGLGEGSAPPVPDAAAATEDEQGDAAAAGVVAVVVLVFGLFVLGSLSPPVVGPLAWWRRRWFRRTLGLLIVVAVVAVITVEAVRARLWTALAESSLGRGLGLPDEMGNLSSWLEESLTESVPGLLRDRPLLCLIVAAAVLAVGIAVAIVCSWFLRTVVYARGGSSAGAKWTTEPSYHPDGVTAAWAVTYGVATGLLAAAVWLVPSELGLTNGLVALALAAGGFLLVVVVPCWLLQRVRRRLGRAAEEAFALARERGEPLATDAEKVRVLFAAGLNQRYLLKPQSGTAAVTPALGLNPPFAGLRRRWRV